MFNQRAPLPEPKSKIAGIVIGLVLLFFCVILPLLQLFIGIGSPGANESYQDDSLELEVQDIKARQWVEDEERKQQQKERQDEYEDYLLWLQETDGR